MFLHPQRMFHQDPRDSNYVKSLPSVIPTTTNGPPFQCLICPKQYPHASKLLFHYVVNHRLRFCGECSVAIPTEQLRMTHENQKHWPLQCRKCYAEFFQREMLNQHYLSQHSLKVCDLCTEVLDLKQSKTYVDHLRLQHDVTSNIMLEVLASKCFVNFAEAGEESTKPISKFNCRLCSKEKMFINFQGHFLNNHKLSKHKFLEITDQFVESQSKTLLDRLGVVSTSKKVAQSQTVGVNDLWDHFEIVRKEEIAGGRTTETVFDFDTSMIQCVASTDEDEDSEDDESAAGSSRMYCLYCSETAIGRHKMGKHLQNIHGFRVRNFDNRCSSCRKSFSTQLALSRHNRIVHHSSDMRSELRKCPFCEDTNKSRDEMRKHIREHVDLVSFPCASDTLAFGCRFCPKAFWTVASKNAHQMSLHTNEMNHNDYIMCVHCGETMSSKTHLRVHTSDAHPTLSQIDKIVFKCEVCLIGYAKLDDCRAHMLMAHPQKLATYCYLETCRTRLSDDQTMDEHLIKVHPTLVRFKCRWCKTMLSSRQGCQKHIRIKHPNLSAKLLHEC